MSHLVEKESILKLSFSVEVVKLAAMSAGVLGADGGGLPAIRRIGSSGWVQHLPWLTQRLQKPQSP